MIGFIAIVVMCWMYVGGAILPTDDQWAAAVSASVIELVIEVIVIGLWVGLSE